MWKTCGMILVMALVLQGFHPQLGAAGEGLHEPPTARIVSESRVFATPDLALLIFVIETEAPRAQVATEKNARRAQTFLTAMKKTLAAKETVQSIRFGVTPVYSSPRKGEGPKITGYRARHNFRVRLRGVAGLGKIIDTGLQNGATGIQGPYFEHSRLEELTRQAAVQALAKARRLAEALAQAEHLKIKRLRQVANETGVRPLSRGLGVMAARAAAETSIEVGEEEIKARVEAVYELE